MDDALSEVLDLACRLAKHRGSKNLGRNDVRVAFEKRLKVRVPFKPPQGPGHNVTHPSSSQMLPLSASAAVNNLQSMAMIEASQPVSTASYKAKLALVKKNQNHASHGGPEQYYHSR